MPGRVVNVGYARGYEGYGNVVVVRTGKLTELYGHLAAYRVHRGQRVRVGQRLGTAGCTVHCTGHASALRDAPRRAHAEPAALRASPAYACRRLSRYALFVSPITCPSGSAKSAIVTWGSSVTGMIVLPPSCSALSSIACGSGVDT